MLAVRLGYLDKAREMLLRTARLDLDDWNNDTDDGLHTTSMAGTWIAAVLGFGGLAVIDDDLSIAPTLAPGWSSLGFHVQFRGTWLSVLATSDEVTVTNRSDASARLTVYGDPVRVDARSSVAIAVT